MTVSNLLRMQPSPKALNRLKKTVHILNPQRGFGSIKQGSKYSPDYKQYLQLPNGEVGSYFHDVPIDLNITERTAQMVVEVPRWSNGKFEISRDLPFNPIVQDMKDGKVRFVHNVFPYHGYIHNYGAIPQTWEDPTVASSCEGLDFLAGDNDPLDCCEIGTNILQTGEIKTVKILGSLALVDDGELDWKVIAIDVDDPIASQLQDLDDVNRQMPGILNATREWFRSYKIPSGKSANVFAFDEKYSNKEVTMNIIQECHDAWRRLLGGSLHSKGLDNLPKTRRAGDQVQMNSNEQHPRAFPPEVNKWWYISK